jgi:hypothetical protein
MIFLSRLVRELSPGARLFLLDADLLFLRAASDSPLDGTLSATTYPLFLANQDWTALSSNAVRATLAFPNRASEAVYNATITALTSLHSQQQNNRDALVEYSPPCLGNQCVGEMKQPPLWITVLSRSGYWPVAMMADHQSDLFSSSA